MLSANAQLVLSTLQELAAEAGVFEVGERTIALMAGLDAPFNGRPPAVAAALAELSAAGLAVRDTAGPWSLAEPLPVAAS